MAISLDAVTVAGTTTGTSLTYSHTATGTNLVAFPLVFGGDTGDFLTDITYDGASIFANLINKSQEPGGGHFMYSFFYAGPPTGAKNIVMTMSASHFISGGVSTYTGCSQTGIPDKKTTNAGHFQTDNTSIADNCWNILHANNGAALSAGTGSTARTNTGISWDIFDSNAAITPPGNYSMTFSGGTEANARTHMFSFSPSAVVVISRAKGSNFLMMGVG